MSRDIKEIADELSSAREQVAKIRQELKIEEEGESYFRAELLEALRAARLKTVKSESGIVFARGERVNYIVTDKERALAWAKRNKCVTVDKAAANKILRTKYPDMPAGFEVRVTEFISIRGNNDNETEDSQ